MSAAFFVSSLIHFRLGPGSVHLTLPGLMGVVLGPLAPLAIIIGLLFQAVMFGHGGVTTLGVNAVAMATPALAIHYGYRAFAATGASNMARLAAAGLLTGAGVLCGAGIMMAALAVSAREFAGIAAVFTAAHAVLALIEGAVTAVALDQLRRVRPEALQW
jgi:cobalt/nickel transport system permease protein